MLVSVLRLSETQKSSHLLLFSEVGSEGGWRRMDILKGKCMPCFQVHKGKVKALLASVDSQLLSAQCQSGIFGDDYSDPRHLTDE